MPLFSPVNSIRGANPPAARRQVHYLGWSKKWDDWAPEKFVLEYNEESCKKQAFRAARRVCFLSLSLSLAHH